MAAATATHTLSRRALLGTIAAAAPIAALPFVAHAETGDAAILAAWEFYRNNYDTDDDAVMKVLCHSEDVLANTPAATLAGIEAKLWIAVDVLVHDMEATRQALCPVGTPVQDVGPINDYAERTLYRTLQDVQRMGRRG